MEQGPTEPHAGRSTFLLSSGGAGGGYYRVAFDTGPIPTQNQFPCRTLQTCLIRSKSGIRGGAQGRALPCPARHGTALRRSALTHPQTVAGPPTATAALKGGLSGTNGGRSRPGLARVPPMQRTGHPACPCPPRGPSPSGITQTRTQGCIGRGGGTSPPPSRRPILCPATVPPTATASFNGVCNRQ